MRLSVLPTIGKCNTAHIYVIHKCSLYRKQEREPVNSNKYSVMDYALQLLSSGNLWRMLTKNFIKTLFEAKDSTNCISWIYPSVVIRDVILRHIVINNRH